jgi:large subunit ribosomal protein L29
MPLPKVEDIRKLSDEELSEQILDTKQELFQLRFQKAIRQTVQPHQFRHARHRLAQMLTVERERQLAAEREAAAQAATATAPSIDTEPTEPEVAKSAEPEAATEQEE